jgi:hypothetical protein
MTATLRVAAALSAAAALFATPLAHAATTRYNDATVGTTKQELQHQQLHSGHVVAFFTPPARHSWMVAPRHSSCRTVSWRPLCRHARQVLRAHRWLHGLATHRLAVLYPPPPPPRLVATYSGYPPHHSLWLCIHASEGAWDDPNSGGNGHYGGLQMHPGWGYGTSYYANADSQATQEWAAERGYAASGYSSTWLNGQWGQTIGPCWEHAT